MMQLSDVQHVFPDDEPWPAFDLTLVHESHALSTFSAFEAEATLLTRVLLEKLDHGIAMPQGAAPSRLHASNLGRAIGGSDRKRTKSVALAVVQQTRVFFTDPIVSAKPCMFQGFSGRERCQTINVTI
jgi:hypothetical protein